jgi:hypothetical protein
MALNPIIKTQKWASVAVKIAIVFSYTNPLLSALFHTILKGSESIKKAVAKTQVFLINSMERIMFFGSLSTRKQLEITFYKYKWKLEQLVNLNSISINYKKKPAPAIERTNKQEEPSTYKLKVDFERAQQIFINWKFNSKIQPNLFSYAALNKTFNGKCAFTLEEIKPWKAIQIADR